MQPIEGLKALCILLLVGGCVHCLHGIRASLSSAWQVAVATEFYALLRNGMWSLVPRSPSMNVIGCKWVFKLKCNPNGSISPHKAHLVAKGFRKHLSIDFNETFNLVVKMITIRLVVALAISFAWSLRQLDVSNAFLHGYMDEIVYMDQPLGFVHPQFLLMCAAYIAQSMAFCRCTVLSSNI